MTPDFAAEVEARRLRLAAHRRQYERDAGVGQEREATMVERSELDRIIDEIHQAWSRGPTRVTVEELKDDYNTTKAIQIILS